MSFAVNVYSGASPLRVHSRTPSCSFPSVSVKIILSGSPSARGEIAVPSFTLSSVGISVRIVSISSPAEISRTVETESEISFSFEIPDGRITSPVMVSSRAVGSFMS